MEEQNGLRMSANKILSKNIGIEDGGSKKMMEPVA
jgi:hypothetical protein